MHVNIKDSQKEERMVVWKSDRSFINLNCKKNYSVCLANPFITQDFHNGVVKIIK